MDEYPRRLEKKRRYRRRKERGKSKCSLPDMTTLSSFMKLLERKKNNLNQKGLYIKFSFIAFVFDVLPLSQTSNSCYSENSGYTSNLKIVKIVKEKFFLSVTLSVVILIVVCSLKVLFSCSDLCSLLSVKRFQFADLLEHVEPKLVTFWPVNTLWKSWREEENDTVTHKNSGYYNKW